MKDLNLEKELQNPAGSSSRYNHLVDGASKWLGLHDHGLEAVRVLMDCGVGNPQLQILLVLEETGVVRFLREAWVWQDQEVSQEFVDHWEFKSRTTTVHGTKIDLSPNNFLDMSGFGSHDQWSTTSLDRLKPTSSCAASRCAAIFPVKGDNWSSALIASCKDELVRDLLVLLSKTIWFPCIKQPSRAPRELICFVLEALDGAEMNWARCVYDKFLAELKRLQILRSSFSGQIRTLAGPLMYFLYRKSLARHKPESLNEIVPYHGEGTASQVQQGDKRMMLEGDNPTIYDDLTFTRLESHDPVDLGPVQSNESTEQAPHDLDPPTPPFSPTRPSKRRRSIARCESSGVTVPSNVPYTSSTTELESTTRSQELELSPTRVLEELEAEIAYKNEEVLGLQLAEIDSRLKAEKMERLYLEEQKHVEECMKLHFAAVEAEEEVADLRAKVNALQDEKREFEKRESFLELQLAYMRRRWETAIMRAELAEIQAAEKSCLLLGLLHPSGK